MRCPKDMPEHSHDSVMCDGTRTDRYQTAHSRCECCDPGRKEHKDVASCFEAQQTVLYRIDMEDRTGVAFCGACADDADDSGLFDDAPNFYSR